jgi:hypothetical protein
MGGNIYIDSVWSAGYKAQSATATLLTQNISGRSGKRIAVRAFGFSNANVSTVLYFMQTLGQTTLSAAAASGGTTIALTAKAIGGSATASIGDIATGDYVAVVLADGTYQFTTVASMQTSLTVTLAAALTDDGEAGAAVYGLGVPADQGHLTYKLTVSTQNTKELDGGVFYGNAKSYPMILYYLSAGATALASLDYLTVDYVNK